VCEKIKRRLLQGERRFSCCSGGNDALLDRERMHIVVDQIKVKNALAARTERADWLRKFASAHQSAEMAYGISGVRRRFSEARISLPVDGRCLRHCVTDLLIDDEPPAIDLS
jgi:hypothetical protein